MTFLHSNFFIISILILLFIFSIAVFFLYRMLIKTKFLNQDLLIKLERCQIVLKSLSDPWCSWVVGENNISMSPAFKKLFRIDPHHPLRLKDFISILGDSNRSPFQRALKHILEYEGTFSLDVNVFDGMQLLKIDGCCVQHTIFYPVDSQEHETSSKKIIVLTIKDITNSISKVEQLEHRIEHITQERDRFKQLLDTCPVAIWSRNEAGRIIACNAMYAKLLDTTAHRAIAENYELIDRFGEIGTFELSKKARLKQNNQTIRTHIVAAGKRHFLEITEAPVIKDCDSTNLLQHTIGYATDITSFEEMEKNLKFTSQAHTQILNHLSSPVAIYGPDSRMLFFNNAYVTMFDQDERWLATQPTLAEIMDHLRQVRKLPEYSDFRAHKQSRMQLFNNLLEPIHEIMHQPDGMICRLVIAPTPSGGLVYIFDNITDRLALERRFNTLTAVQKETLDNLYEGIIVFGTDYRLRLANLAVAKIWGLKSLPQAEGTHINEMLKEVAPQFKSAKASQTWRTKMLDIISKRRPDKQRIRLKKDKALEYTYVPLPDGSHLLSFIDVSDTWLHEKALQEKNQALEHQNRLKSDFIAHVSYELQSPLHTILGFSELLMNQYFGALNEKQMDYSKGISEAAERLSNLLSDLLDLASIQAGTLTLNYQTVSAQALLSSLVLLVQNRASDHGLELIIDNQIGDMKIKVDAQRIRHAFFNLLSNAIKFTPSGGRITVHAFLCHEKKQVYFTVEDNGAGIKPSQLKRIQDYFKRAIPSSQLLTSAKNDENNLAKNMALPNGMHADLDDNESDEQQNDNHNTIGLGLTLVHRFIELHNGYMEIESALHEGTTIRCVLPHVAQV